MLRVPEPRNRPEITACEDIEGATPDVTRITRLTADAVQQTALHYFVLIFADTMEEQRAETERYFAEMMGLLGKIRQEHLALEAMAPDFTCPRLTERLPIYEPIRPDRWDSGYDTFPDRWPEGYDLKPPERWPSSS